MNHSTLDILTQQRKFFIGAILIIIIDNIISLGYHSYLHFLNSQNENIPSFLPITYHILDSISLLIIFIYGFYICKKGYLKRYALFAFAVGIIKVIVPYILMLIPAFNRMIEAMSPTERSLYYGVSGMITWIILIISVSSSAMNRLMKWGLSVGYIAMCMLIAYTPFLLFSYEIIKSNYLKYQIVPQYIICFIFYLAALGCIAYYYNRRIRKEEEEGPTNPETKQAETINLSLENHEDERE